jgi:hypothetical protein
LTEAEARSAEELILDASSMIRTLYPTIDARIADGKLAFRVVTAVVCDMVKRSMLARDSGAVTQSSETVGVFSASATYFNPSGDMYLTRAEKQLLGVGERVRNVRFSGRYALRAITDCE